MSGALTEFTPFGYLRNPGHVARSWSDVSGGNLRTAVDYVGVEWAYPVGRDVTSRVGLGLEAIVDGRVHRSRADFEALGLTSRHHSCLIFGFDWQTLGVRVEARYFLADDDALCLRLTLVNEMLRSADAAILVVGRAALGTEPSAETNTDSDALVATAPSPHVVVGWRGGDVQLAPGEHRVFMAALARGDDAEIAGGRGGALLEAAEVTWHARQAEDAAFAATCPTLDGDWPDHWAEGLHHDFQTTRLLVQPPRGIFRDVWPSWMAAWPRVVFAEGTLDMLRLAYAEPELAKRAVLSLLRDAPGPNVPCVFSGGQFNMVAADGSRCGTSPAWCLPFLNLELLYLRSLDRQWLAQVYPYAAAYLEWWLEHRTDAEGWLVYKCTWESGEDGNPRLDPSGSGDADISRRVRPVELQATMAHAANVMGFFASELGLPLERWQAIEADYRRRTRQMFDPEQQRYRDVLIPEAHFQESCPDTPYWDVDACRYSAQSLTPLLIGERLPEDEIAAHAAPPWTLWPSWTWSIVESAGAAGFGSLVGQLAFETIDRVYRITTRRDVGSFSRPLPGSSPEFWPLDWATYGGSDAYGWGATTANLLIRHLFGFKESRRTDIWVAELAPAFPDSLLRFGRDFGIQGLNYRAVFFDLTYTVETAGLHAALELHGDARVCRVESPSEVLYAATEPSRRHAFSLAWGQPARLILG